MLTRFTDAVRSSSQPVRPARDGPALPLALKKSEHHSNQGAARRNICFRLLFHLARRVLENGPPSHLFPATTPELNPLDPGFKFATLQTASAERRGNDRSAKCL